MDTPVAPVRILAYHPPLAYEDGVGQGHENHHEVELEAGCEVLPPRKERENLA